MCLIVFSFQDHSEYPFILAGNRDEFYARKALQAHFWDTDPPFLAGKDKRAGGTWLGVSVTGEFGAITNHRNFHNPKEGERSRGEIITNFLTRPADPPTKLEQLQKNGHHYSGFNLLAGSLSNLYYLSNIKGKSQKIKPGIHGISNAFLDTSWPKVDTAITYFKDAIDHDEIDQEAIFKFLKNSETYPEESLPDTGLSPEMEKAVSPIFIKTDGYGTRCSTILTIHKTGRVNFIEKTYPVTDDASESVLEFSFDLRK